MTDGILGGAQNPPSANNANAPEITVVLADDTAGEAQNIQTSSTPSPVLSYMHTPAEPYESEFSAKGPLGKQLLHATVAQNSEDTRNATVASLQAVIDEAGMVPGSVWYMVGRKWYAAWQESASGLVQHEIGPIDNSEIVDASNELLPGLKLTEDVEAVPVGVWQQMAVLYGVKDQQQAVRRVAVQSSDDGKAVLDLYPPSVFAVSKGSLGQTGSEVTHRVVISLDAPLSELKFQIRRIFNLDADQGLFGDMKLFRPAANCTNGTAGVSSNTPLHPPPYEDTVTNDKVVDLGINAGNQTAQKLEEINGDDTVLLMAAGILPDSTV
ncbi:hypothetical protein GGH97_003287, partial [Coemansia sp. RSA 475]